MKIIERITIWLQERKQKKCASKEHPKKTQTVQYWQYPPPRESCVLQKVTSEISTCKCGEKKSEKILDTNNFHGVSWPSHMWDELKREGRLYI